MFLCGCEREPTSPAASASGTTSPTTPSTSPIPTLPSPTAYPTSDGTLAITLRVAAASDLLFVFDALSQDFTTRAAASSDPFASSRTVTPIKLTVSFGSSGNFVSQIRNNAPFDLFLSADLAYPQALQDEGLVLDNLVIEYATGHLALWWARSTLPTTNSLLDPAVKTIAIANPAHAPYGRAAVEALKSLGLYESVKVKLVYGDSASHAFQFAQSGAADIGMVPYSMVMGQPTSSGSAILLTPDTQLPQPPHHPTTLHSPIIQGACIIRTTQNAQAAQLFLNYLTSPSAQAILREFGFSTPESSQNP